MADEYEPTHPPVSPSDVDAAEEWTIDARMAEAFCEHDWQEQPGEPPVDICSRCGKQRY